ncbi:MAG TPA: SCO family protein [Luteibaculaceae bacterium]|nr:SCO family protein [Luteibaculaceae bacterium]
MSFSISSGGWKVLGFAVVFAAGTAYAYQLFTQAKPLPIYQPRDLNPRLVDSIALTKGYQHRILDFDLVDQDGKRVDRSITEGKIVVADFFFTTCQSICPKMTTQMKRVADAYADLDQLLILSHTVDPETDSIQVLHAYAQQNNIDTKRWKLLTGGSKEIYRLARQSYFAALDEPSKEGPDFVHTENFVLVDTKGRLRGFYDGTSPEEVDQLIADIKNLSQEIKNEN